MSSSIRTEPAKPSISSSVTPVSCTTKVAAPAASYPASTSPWRSWIWPAKNATARIAAAIASAAKLDRGQAWRRSTRASHRSPRFTALLPQLPRDVFAELPQHTRDGRLDLRWRRAVFQLLIKGVEQQLSFPGLASRDHGSNFVPVGPGFLELGLGLCGIARSIRGVD